MDWWDRGCRPWEYEEDERPEALEVLILQSILA